MEILFIGDKLQVGLNMQLLNLQVDLKELYLEKDHLECYLTKHYLTMNHLTFNLCQKYIIVNHSKYVVTQYLKILQLVIRMNYLVLKIILFWLLLVLKMIKYNYLLLQLYSYLIFKYKYLNNQNKKYISKYKDIDHISLE